MRFVYVHLIGCIQGDTNVISNNYFEEQREKEKKMFHQRPCVKWEINILIKSDHIDRFN